MTTAPPPDLVATRATLHRVAAHVLGRRRHQVTGRFGLRASPGGFATPAFGDGPEVVRVAGGWLVREVGGKATAVPLAGAGLRQLAAWVDADVLAEFSVGADGPPVGDVDEPLVLEAAAAAVISDWYSLGWRVLDAVVAGLPPEAEPDTVQLWPEHFDAGTSVGVGGVGSGAAGRRGGGARANLGASPGDGFSEEPYLYVGPWGVERPGDASYWNAPFGAVLPWSALAGVEDRAGAGVAFLETGLALLAGGRSGEGSGAPVGGKAGGAR